MSGKPSAAGTKARLAIEKNPKLTVKAAATRYGISVSTIYRAKWYKELVAARKETVCDAQD